MRAFHSEQTIRKKVQKNKDQTCNELQLIFLGSEKQPLFECKCECNFECNCRFSWFSEILSYCQKPLKNKAFPTSIVSYLSFSDASSPVSRTTETLDLQGLTVVRNYKSCGSGRERCDREGHAVFLRPRVDSAIMGSASTGISTSSTKLKMISTFCLRLPSDLSGA